MITSEKSGNKLKKSETLVISRASRFSKSTLWYAYPWRDSRIYLFYVILAAAVPIVIKDISNKVILRATVVKTSLPRKNERKIIQLRFFA